MSSLLLAIHSYPGANHRIPVHWPYFEKSGADKIIGIGTTDGGCKWPDGVDSVNIGRNSYIDGDVLPRRLMDTMRFMLLMPFDRFAIAEWDCLFFHPLPEFTGLAAFHAGNRSEGMRTERYHHCPWCFDFDSGRTFLSKADELIKDVSGHECSPDVFFGWVCQEAGLLVAQPWVGFTRNTIESPQDAELARDSYRAGAMAIHGIKGRSTLDQILS